MRMPRANAYKKAKVVYRTAKKAMPKAARKIDAAINAVEKGVRFRESIANQPLDFVARECMSMAAKMKTPIGSLGLSLMPGAAKEASISGAAVGDVTTSATMYAFRPPRKRRREGELNYIQKMTTSYRASTAAYSQSVLDMNILDAVDVGDNSTTYPYSRLTIKKCFDKYLTSQVENVDDGSAPTSLKKQQTSIHIQSVSSELLIQNNNSTVALVDIYELVPQHTLGPSTYSSQFYANGYMSPAWTYANGVTDTVMLEDTLSSTNLSSKPTDSSLWYRTWRVIKKVRVNLTGNALHRHKSSLAVNKTVTYPEFAQFSTQGGKFAGWNPTYMIVQKGGPSGNDVTGAVDCTYTCNMEMRYSASSQEQAKVIIFDSTS